jgi:hypothetical protein
MAEANDSEKKFRWTKASTEAAVLLAEDELTNEHIAEQCGVSVPTLWRWRQHPEFTERIAEHTAALQATMLRHAVAKRHKRLATLDRLHTKALGVIESRADEMDGEAPGAETGLLVKTFKQIGQGPGAQMVTEYAVDTALMREIRAIEEQAAKELGQWEEKQAVTGSVAVRRYIGIDVEAV